MRRKAIIKISLAVFITITVIITFSLTFVEFLGPKINDSYADKKLNTLDFSLLPDNIKVKEYSKYIGHAEKDFVIWIGFISETKLTISQLNSQLNNIDGFQDADISIYSHESANLLNFTGTQKELTENDISNHYIIGIVLKPKTPFDKRN